MKKDKFDQFINSKLHKEEMLKVKGGEDPQGDPTDGGTLATAQSESGWIQYTSDTDYGGGNITYHGVTEYAEGTPGGGFVGG